MRRRLILSALPLLALAACHARIDVGDADDGADGNVQVALADNGKGANKISVDLPGFKANMALPELNLGGHIDLDGIKVAPGTKLGTFDITARETSGGEDDGRVRLGFTNPDAPSRVIDHYARSAADAGYTAIARTATSLTARKAEKTFALQVAPQGAGSTGTITMAGKE